MTDTISREFELLHAVRIKGLATDEVLAELSGVPADDLADATEPLVEAGFLVRRAGRFSGYSTTPAGKEEAAKRLASDEPTVAAQSELESFYKAFLPINGDFKRVCQSWQIKGDQPNDHTDADYDAGVVVELGKLNESIQASLADVASALPRLGRYSPRLSAALERIRGGDSGAFARPMANSYHDIWMELHEDLIVSCGRVRGEHDEA